MPSIPLSSVEICPDFNPRRHFDPDKLQRLANSIRDQGLIQPITVRPKESGEGYWLVAGERRLRALRLIQADEVLVTIRDCSAEEARWLALTENLDRADIGPGEEARYVRRLLETCEGDREEVARRLGWAPRKLASRLALLQATETVLDALDAGSILLGHAELLATLPADTQDKVLARVIENGATVEALREQLQGFAIPLRTAIFDTAGCAGCPHNSDTTAQNDLFGSRIERGLCTGKACFQGKTDAAIGARIETLREDYALVQRETEVEKGSYIPLSAEDPSGVGHEQIATGCAGCRFRGALITDRIGPQCGTVIGPVCFQRTCHSERLEERRAAQAPPPAPSGSAGTGSAAPAPAQPSTSVPKPAAKATTKPPAKAAAAPARVVDQHAATFRRAVLAALPDKPAWPLALALNALVRQVTETIGVGAETEALRGIEKAKTDEARIAVLAQLDPADLQERLATLTRLLFETKPEHMPFRGIKRRCLAVHLCERSATDLTPHVQVDKDFLSAHTKAAIEALLVESGFSAWLEQQPDGKDALAKLRSAKREPMIDAILAAGFDWTGYRPSGIEDARKRLIAEG